MKSNSLEIARHLSEVLARVGVVDFAALVRVKPDLALAAVKHASGKALLQLQRHHSP